MKNAKVENSKNLIEIILVPGIFIFTSIAYLFTTSIRKDIIEIRDSIKKNKGL